MIPEFVAPDYPGQSLAQLLPSILARLSGNNAAIEIPAADTYVVLLVDGLGQLQLQQYAEHATHLTSLPASTLTCGVPSTTATSLTSLGCGLPPGQHGIVGYSFRNPLSGELLNALTWDGGPSDPMTLKLASTIFEQLPQHSCSAGSVTLAKFAGTALTKFAFSGAELAPVVKETDAARFAELVASSARRHDLVYAYHRLLDHDGHGHGVGSWKWLDRLAEVDDLVSQLQASLPDGVCLLVTGDHGMVNVPQHHRITAEEQPQLTGYELLAGEGRFRQVYTRDSAELAARWAAFLGERALVLRREEAIEAGWFGPVIAPPALQRIGDVLVAMRDDWAIMTSQSPNEFSLVGMHGSLSRAEMLVPLVIAGGH